MAKWDVTDWFNLQARTSLDANADREEVKMYATTDVSLAGNKNGLYEYGQSRTRSCTATSSRPSTSSSATSA
jgi:hypothetical protein